MAVGFTSYIVPYVGSGRKKEVLMIAGKRRDRSFFGGDFDEVPGSTVHVLINQMREMGGVDVGSEKFESLCYVSSTATKRAQTWWGLRLDRDTKEEIISNWDQSIGKLMVVPILGVWAQLWQIPDTQKGIPLAEYWKNTILPILEWK